MAFQGKTPHFVLLPYLAQGHLIPMADTARLLAERRGVIVTILVTPENGKRIKSVIDHAMESGVSIRVFHLKFPCAEAGLPEGCENVEMLPSPKYFLNFVKAITMLREQVEEVLQELKPFPSCLIADQLFSWATNVALKLHIPRLMFYGTSFFCLLCTHMLRASKDFEAVTNSETDYFVVPDMPDRIEITKAQLRGIAAEISPYWTEYFKEIEESVEGAFGVINNSFEELEREYVEKYMKVKGKKVWCIGPVSLCNRADSDKAERGNKASIDQHQCLKWLDSCESSSVIYVCLGSFSLMPTSQMIELGLGLEASNRPFIWVIKDASNEFKAWLLEEEFEERTNGRCLLIRGWAPQLLILSHPSVGGFLTHCGWNSALEGVTAGLPMVTWPEAADHFCNEKVIVNVIKTGIRLGIEVPVSVGERENVGLQVNRDDIKIVIDKLMDGGEEGRERRERARKLGEMAKRAVEEGGSSYNNMTQLIQEVILQQAKKTNLQMIQ